MGGGSSSKNATMARLGRIMWKGRRKMEADWSGGEGKRKEGRGRRKRRKRGGGGKEKVEW